MPCEQGGEVWRGRAALRPFRGSDFTRLAMPGRGSVLTAPLAALRRCSGSSTDAQIGNMAVCLALTLAAVVMALLYMPVVRNIDSTLLQVGRNVIRAWQASEGVAPRRGSAVLTGSRSRRPGRPGRKLQELPHACRAGLPPENRLCGPCRHGMKDLWVSRDEFV